MNQQELREKVITKLNFKPHIKHVEQSYVVDTVNDAVNDAL